MTEKREGHIMPYIAEQTITHGDTGEQIFSISEAGKGYYQLANTNFESD